MRPRFFRGCGNAAYASCCCPFLVTGCLLRLCVVFLTCSAVPGCLFLLITTQVWAIIKSVLEERTRNKIVITNKQTDAALLELVSDDVLPTFLGGKCPCSIGEKIRNSGASFTEAPIKARGDLKIAVDVAEGGVLGWEFMLESHDIKFGVYRFHSGSYTDKLAVTSGDVVRPLSKSETKGELQAETLENCKGGTYVLYWDNSYSMMTAKTLKYIYEVA